MDSDAATDIEDDGADQEHGASSFVDEMSSSNSSGHEAEAGSDCNRASSSHDGEVKAVGVDEERPSSPRLLMDLEIHHLDGGTLSVPVQTNDRVGDLRKHLNTLFKLPAHQVVQLVAGERILDSDREELTPLACGPPVTALVVSRPRSRKTQAFLRRLGKRSDDLVSLPLFEVPFRCEKEDGVSLAECLASLAPERASFGKPYYQGAHGVGRRYPAPGAQGIGIPAFQSMVGALENIGRPLSSLRTLTFYLSEEDGFDAKLFRRILTLCPNVTNLNIQGELELDCGQLLGLRSECQNVTITI